MKNSARWMAAALLFGCLQWTACRQNEEAPADEENGTVKVEHLDGAEPARITLSESAAKRLDIQTAPIRDDVIGGAQRQVIPYAAILYDTQGDTWTFTNPEPLTYMRHHIKVDHIAGDQVVLSEGPSTGTAVVTVGAAELYGSEIEFEEE